MTKSLEKTTLSNREKEVLECLLQGLSNKEIAKILNVTHHTIKAHVGVIIHKLGAKNRLDAAMIAVKNDLLNRPQD